MKKIEILYNPYTEKTDLWVENADYTGSGSRVAEFVADRPIEQWISYYSVSYKRWDGFLPELTEELNDDGLQLIFYGTKADYEIFSAGISQTYADVRARGFEPDNGRLSWKEKYAPQEMLPLFRRFAGQQVKMLTGQMDLLRMETICSQLEQADSMDVRTIRTIVKNMDTFLQEVAQASQPQKLKQYWQGTVRKFRRMCREGGSCNQRT